MKLNLREDLKNRFNLADECFSSHETDLHVLTDSQAIFEYIKNAGSRPVWCWSNVKGQSWYGKRFIDVPFALLDEKMRRMI